MADLTNYITGNGVIIPDTSSLKETVENEFKAALGQDLDVSPETPQGRLIEAETLARKAVLDTNALVANAFNPQTSFDGFLDALSALTGTARNTGTRTTILCTLSGVPGTLIPAGAQARTAAGDVFQLVNSYTLPESGTAQRYFEAVEPGPVPCAVGTLTQIITPVLGWETVNNPIAAVIGSDPETDASLRARRQSELYKGSALLKSIISATRQVAGVSSVFALENYTDAPQTIQGIEVGPHSIYVVADGGSNEDIALAIWAHKSLGCGYTGDVEVTVLGEFGQEYLVKFNRPQFVPVKISITVRTPQTSIAGDLAQSVKDALSAWANGDVAGVQGLQLGVSVSPFEAAAAVSAQLPDLFVSNVQISAQTGELGTAVLPINPNERATLAQADITVTVTQ